MKKFLLALLCIVIVSTNINAQQTPFLQWQKAYGGTNTDEASSIQQTTDRGYIIAGSSNSTNRDVTGNHGGHDYWIIKSDANGKIQWQKSLGGSSDDYASCIHQTADGGYIVAGTSYSNDGDVTGNHGAQDYWIVKLSATGELQWQKTLGGSDYDRASSIQQTIDGGYIVAGGSYSNDGDVTGSHGKSDYWIVKLSETGELQWQKALGGSDYEQANSIRQTVDGEYIVAGSSNSNDGDVTGHHRKDDYWIVKLSATGELQWQKIFGGSAYDIANSILQTTDSGYIAVGASYSNNGDVTGNHGQGDSWVIKLDANGGLQWQKTFGGSDFDYSTSIQQTVDGKYIVAGFTASNDGDVSGNHGLVDYWIIKLSTTGKLQWQKTFGGSSRDYASDVRQTIDGGYIATGWASSKDRNVTDNHGGHDYWIVKLSPQTLNDSITIFPYHLAKNCTATNSVSCDIKNKSKAYTVHLYWFGEIYDSAVNVTGHTGFHNLPAGAYYLTATDENGNINYSEEVGIMPIPTNTVTTNITATTAQLNWTGFDCAGDYRIQFRVQGKSDWHERQTDSNITSY